jgi:Spy/CpxP family protein refolding chaperone
MKNLKVVAIALLLSMLAINSAQGQEKPAVPAEQKQEMAKQNQQNKDRLGLTKEQQVPYKEIVKRYAQLMRELKGSGLPHDAKKEKLTVLISQRDAELKALLTPEQYKTYTEIQEEKKAKYLQLRK